MKGTEKIIAHIQADAQAQAAAILAQAEQQCAGIREDYDRQAQELYREKIRAGVADCQDKADSAARIARMEAKKNILALKQDMVSASFDLARRKITELPAEQYIDFLARTAAAASSTGDEEMLLNARDRDSIGAQTVEAANAKLGGGKLTLAAEAGDFDGGFILRRGNIEVNCTVELLVELCRADMSAKIAGVLFE